MSLSISNLPIQGTNDIFGINLRKLDYLFRKFTDVIQRYGYEQLEVPIIERASSFSEDIVGQSPWPEWDKRGCFYLKINNYNNSFEKVEEVVDALLIPEGTISVTRWLGYYLESTSNATLPLKIFYRLPCFRNELINSLSESKRRQFQQFGIEILGSEKITSDIEIIYLIKRLLVEVGIESKNIRVRISNVGIFNKLVQKSKISHEDSIHLKEAMDTIAECRAGKKPERREKNEVNFYKILASYNLNDSEFNIWKTILNHNSGKITSDMFDIFPQEYKSLLDELSIVCNELQKNDVNSILDLCVVRSHEYYTGISFEVDVVTTDKSYIEIAGGGRYDKLVGNFVKNYKQSIIPSTGFAFGLERLVEMLDNLGKFEHNTAIDSSISFEDSNADILLLLASDLNPIDQYFKAVNEIETNKKNRYDIYMGNLDESEIYQNQRRIKSLISL